MTKAVLRFCAAAMTLLALAGRVEAGEVRVADAATGAPIADAVVIVADHELRTDALGAVQVDDPGDRVMARAPGYRAAAAAPDLARSGGVLKLTPFTPKGLYLTVYGIGSKTLRNGALSLVKDGAVNSLVIDLKGDRGIVPYPSQAALPSARKITTIRDLAALAADLHRSGVYLIARIVVFKDDPLASAKPDLAVKRADGRIFRDREGLAWTDPFRPEVRDYNVALAVEAAQAGFDEIQFDYLRFPDQVGGLRLSQPSTEATRTRAIAEFLAQARRRLIPYNVFLSADVFGYVCWNRNDTGIGQQLEAIMPQVDYLSPMLYPSGFQFGIPGIRNPVADSYAIVRQSLTEAQMRLKVSPKRFRPWLQAFRDYAFDRRVFDANEIADQIRAATDFGSDGWMLWNARNTYAGDGLAAVTRTPLIALVAERSNRSSLAACS
jgi:hypothetical protein